MAESDTEQPVAATEQPAVTPESLTMVHESGSQVSISLPDLSLFTTTKKGILRNVDPQYQGILEKNGFTVSTDIASSAEDGTGAS